MAMLGGFIRGGRGIDGWIAEIKVKEKWVYFSTAHESLRDLVRRYSDNYRNDIQDCIRFRNLGTLGIFDANDANSFIRQARKKKYNKVNWGKEGF
jgi:hypothetical protein